MFERAGERGQRSVFKGALFGVFAVMLGRLGVTRRLLKLGTLLFQVGGDGWRKWKKQKMQK